MFGTSLLRSRLLRLSRKRYNSGFYSSSARYSALTFFLFRDRESLDILARSHLRKKNFDKSKKAYRKAVKRGFSLLDHEINHFKSELGSQNFLQAYIILQDIAGKSNKRKCVLQLERELSRITDTERVSIIEEMSSISPLPLEISELLPWSQTKIEYEKIEDDDFGIIHAKNISSDRHLREISRIKSSGAYRITEHIAKSIRNPLRLILLPFSTILLIIEIIRQRTGSLSSERSSMNLSGPAEKRRNSIVFFPTNGVGFGHFTRLLAIARKYRDSNPKSEIVFFTTMPTLHILAEEGFVCYHMPGRYRYKGMEPKSWNALCEEMLTLILSIHRPSAFVFDGSYPYRGMLDSIKSASKSMLRVWVRRGAIRSGSKPIPVDSIGHFHAIIRPGDSVSDRFEDETRHNVTILKTNPILLDSEKGDSQLFGLRRRLGVPEEATLCYVQLGAGQINDIDSELKLTLSALESYPETYVVLGESMLGSRIPIESERIRVLRDYPNSKYFDEFDFAVIAGGYNSYHEVVNSGLPSICFPNLSTGRDDQLSRANIAKENGGMIVIEKRTPEKIGLALMRMMDYEFRSSMRDALAGMAMPNGASEASDWLIDQI